MLNKKSRISFIILPIAILLTLACAFSLRAPVYENASVAHAEEIIPQEISTAQELLLVAETINDPTKSEDYLSYSYSLSNNIDLNGFTLSAIGTEERPFNGTFDGNGFVISNLTLNAAYANVGLFGYVGESATITSVGLLDAKITTDFSNVGGIAGYSAGTITNCFYHGTISGFANVGGVVGYNEGTINNCFSNGTIAATQFDPNLGGLIGYNNGSLDYSYSIAKINYSVPSGGKISNIGGIIGGRGLNATKPSYTFFNSSLNTQIEAVGFEPINFLPTSATKRTRVEFNTMDMLSLLNVSSLKATWSRVYNVSNHSAYVAPLQAVFSQKLSDANLNDSTKKELNKMYETACSERMYGIDTTKDGEWGKVENPYLISSEQHLRNLQSAVTNDAQTYADNIFIQNRDINLTARFYPIGSYLQSRRFQGTYDGGNRNITNIDISATGSESEYLGLFGYIGEKATIKNLSIDGTVKGKQYIGSLVGYNYEGTIENIETNVEVSAEANCGGVVGLTRKGKYINILSKATLKLVGNTSGGHYGIIGKYQEVVPETIQRAWYFVELGSQFTQTNNMGSAFIADNRNGTIEATKSSDGTITFNAKQTANGYAMEFRTADENIVSNLEEYSVIYGRFAREFDIETDFTYASLKFFGAGNNEIKTFYTGQLFTIVIDISEGVYVKEVITKDASDKKIANVRPSFNYDPNNTEVLYTAEMTNDLASVYVDVQRITYDEELFSDKHTYNGQGVRFPVEILEKPEGYNISVVYSGQEEPSQANQSALDNYSLTIIYQNSNGVRMGSRNVSFRIEKAPLYIINPEGVLGREKEWDNSLSPTPTTVEQAGVEGIVEGDVVTVSGMMSFNTVDVTEGYTAVVTYSFTLTGADANNYIAPITQSYAGYLGKITKRNITVSFDSYEGLFAGLNREPSLNGKKITTQGVLSAQPYEAIYEFTAMDGQVQGAVGKYQLSVSLSETIYSDASKYYNIQFANATDGYVIYTVKALPVKAEYLIDGAIKDNITYDAVEHTVTAYYLNETGNKVNLQIALAKGEDTVSSLLGASEYTASVVEFSDSNYDLGDSASKILIVNKADQVGFSITSEASWEFGTSYQATTSGGNGIGAVTFEVSEEYGTFSGATLTILKAGTITITATKAEDDNYNSVTATLDLEVTKSALTIFVNDIVANYLDELTFNFEAQSGVAPSGVTGVKVLIDGVEYNGENLDARVEPYQISIDVSNAVSDGYQLVAGECGTLTINKLKVTLTPEANTSVYGESINTINYILTDEQEASVEFKLDGSLSTSAKNVGEFDIEIGDMIELNPNFEIAFVEGVKYTVTAKTLTVKAINATKHYGESDPEPLYEVVGLQYDDTEQSIGLTVSIGRMVGEDSYMEGSDHAKVYNYYKNAITHSSANYNTVVEFESAYLSILPGEPTVASVSQVSAVAGSTLAKNGTPTAQITGNIYDASTATWSSQTLQGEISWKQDATLNFKASEVLTYKAIFTPDNKNFTSKEFDVEIKVIPVEITVKFLSSKQVTYDGYDHDDVKYELTGLIAGDDAEDSISYEGDYKNAGSFKAKVSINNHNYKLVGGETTIKILKADLSVSVQDMTIVEGQNVTVAYMYFGLQRGDTEDSFDRLPSVKLPTKPGTYTLTPSGASADNYNISYNSFSFKVLSKALANEAGDVNLEGAFDADTKFELVEVESSSEISNLYSDVQSSYANLENKEIEKIFELKYTINDELVMVEGKTYLTMLKPTGYEDSAVAYAIYTANNELVYAQDIVYDGDYVTIDVTNAKAIVFLNEQEDNSMMLYIAIAAVVVVVLIVVLIVSKVKKRREARYIKYNED